MKEAIIYLLAITAAEAVTVFVQPVWGIVCHAIVLVAVIVHSAVLDRHFYGRLILSLALVPLVRIISLCVPLVNIPQNPSDVVVSYYLCPITGSSNKGSACLGT